MADTNELMLPPVYIMTILLSIDTSGTTATVALGNEKGIIASESNDDQKNHAGFVQPAIRRILLASSARFTDVDAIAVVNGPGSYTGLRVGLASAKAICYALNKPMIVLNTLTVMALAAIKYFPDDFDLYCPLIDARRSEVFTAVYNSALTVLLPPQPVIVEPESFNRFLDNRTVIFFGSGHNKCEKIIHHKNAVFKDVSYKPDHINELASEAYTNRKFADIAYTEPFYTKEFFTPG